MAVTEEGIFMGDENKNNAGLPDKTLRRLSSTSEND